MSMFILILATVIKPDFKFKTVVFNRSNLGIIMSWFHNINIVISSDTYFM